VRVSIAGGRGKGWEGLEVLRSKESPVPAPSQGQDGLGLSIVPRLFLYCSSIVPLLAGVFFGALQGGEPEATPDLAAIGSIPEDA
jgi:hypothetical protein